MPLGIVLALLVLLAVVILMAGISMQMFQPDPVHQRLAQFADRQRTLEEMELETHGNSSVKRLRCSKD